MPPFKERGKLRRDSGAPGPPRLSVGTVREAGARCALPAAHGGFPALHLMHSGCLSHPGAPQACPAPRTLPHALEMRTILPACGPHRNAQERTAATSSPPPRHAPSVSDSGTPAAGAGGRGPCWWLPWDPDLGWKGGGLRDLTLPTTTRLGVFVFPFRPRGIAPPGRPSSRVQPARTFSFPRSLSLSSLFLALFPFFLAPDSRGKVAFPSLPKCYASLSGGLWEQGVCCAFDPRSSGGLALALPRIG